MNSKAKVKASANNENICPIERKRRKISSSCSKLSKAESKISFLEQMGIGMLESDESSSSGNTVDVPLKTNFGDEGFTAIPQDQKCELEYTEKEIGKQTVSDVKAANFTHPKDSSILSSNRGCNSIEIYVDNKVNEKTHKRLAVNSHAKGRSPLATVSCNNNQNNISQSNVSVDSIKKQIFIPDENFFLFRKKLSKTSPTRDPFKKLSDEMILQIFKWLPKKTLIRCGQVCCRFNQLSRDESLWTRLDLGCKTLRSGALGQVVSRGVVILRLAQAEISDPIFAADSVENTPEFQTKLQYLDLSMAVISKPSLKLLLSKCTQLKKLSLEHVPVNAEICSEIAKNTNLEALNLTMCEGLEKWSVEQLMKELQQLLSLNISWSSLNVETVKALADNVTPNLLRLNMAGCRKSLFDSHLTILARRCPGLVEIDLSDCTALTSFSMSILCKFKDLEYLSLSRCYGISASAYMDLNNLTALRYLDVFGLLSDKALTMLQNTFPSLGINKFIHSSVARPTVGTKRTSIWGLRTRD